MQDQKQLCHHLTKMLHNTDNIMLHTCMLGVETIFVQHFFSSSTNSSFSIKVDDSILRIQNINVF